MSWHQTIALAGLMAVTCISGAQSTVSTVEAARSNVIGGLGMPGVKGQPFSLVDETTQVQTLSDGRVIATRSAVHQMRDSKGRMRTEFGAVRNGQFERQTIVLTDPVARIAATLFVRGKTGFVTHLGPPWSPTPEQEAKMTRSWQAFFDGTPALPSGYEELQSETIAGMHAIGRRRIVTNAEGRTEEDMWISPDLNITMRSMKNDPRVGRVTTEVTELDRKEPDPALFHIPADYKITQRTE